MKLRLLGSVVLLLSALHIAQAQEIRPCATPSGKVDWLVQYQQNPPQIFVNEDTLWIPLTIHLVGENDGSGYFDTALLYQQVCALNVDFAESGLQFYVKGELRYIPNSMYNNHNFNQGIQMMGENFVERTINAYVCDSPGGACGYSVYDLGIALNEDCMQNGNHTFAHEVGHYLSLPHIFDGWEGTTYDEEEPTPPFLGNGAEVELVDGSNCGSAGDGFCDTPIDYLSYRWGCQSNNFSNQVQKDPTGVEFESDGSYIMSYTLDNCRSIFSPEQMDAMVANVLTEKFDFLDQDIIPGPVDIDNLTPIFPSEGAFVAEISSITAEWDPVPNASQYEVQFSPLSSFSVVLFSEIVDDPFVNYPEVLPNATLYWRVRPYNDFTVCEAWSSTFSFQTGDLTSTNTVSLLQNLIVSPVPASVGETIFVSINLAQASDIQLELTDLNGRIIPQKQQAGQTGLHKFTWSTEELQAGVYLLQICTAGQRATRKVVITD
ncbi:MAG: zinc-dependent metalloprotease [Bacteroidota bacterium]